MRISNFTCDFLNNTNYYEVFNSGNIFSIADKRFENKQGKLTEPEVNFLPIYLTKDIIDIIEVTELIKNPLLPNEIAKHLREIFSSKFIYSKRPASDFEYDFVLIDELRIMDAKDLDEYNPKRFSEYICNLGMNYGDFLLKIDATRNEINKWLKKIGINDLNFEWNK